MKKSGFLTLGYFLIFVFLTGCSKSSLNSFLERLAATGGNSQPDNSSASSSVPAVTTQTKEEIDAQAYVSQNYRLEWATVITPVDSGEAGHASHFSIAGEIY